jgi:putative toxin-antitoxin system antitoxin component (TIGR02293 family)
MASIIVPDAEAIMLEPRSKSAAGGQALSVQSQGAGPLELVELVRAGVPWGLYQGFVSDLGLSEQAAAGFLHIPPRTLARRKGGRLEPQESERLMRLVRLVAQATDVLGTTKKAMDWLDSPNGALQGVTPLSLLDTDIGTQAAEAVLARIEYGVFS